MIRASVLAVVTVVAVTSAAIAGPVAVTTNGVDGNSCTCTTIDVSSESVTLVVFANGTGGASVSQQVSQTDDYTRVRVEIESGETSVAISGETVSNGSLLLNVTRDGKVVNGSFSVDPREIGTVAFHLESDGVRISTDSDSGCKCGDAVDIAADASSDDLGNATGVELSEACGVASDVEVSGTDGVQVNVGDGTNVNAGNVEVDISIGSSGDSETDGDQIIDDSDDETHSKRNTDRGSDDVNAASDDVNAASGVACAKESLHEPRSLSDSSTPGRLSADAGATRDVFLVVIRPHDIAGLAVVGDDRRVSIGSIISGLGQVFGTESNRN